jgi:hypothetical protein
MKIELDKNFIKELLVQESFYNIVYEYFFLKEAGAKIADALGSPGGCSACTEKNLIDPSVSAFMSHTVNMYLDCGPEALIRFKIYVRMLREIPQDEEFYISVLYKDNDGAEIQELLI